MIDAIEVLMLIAYQQRRQMEPNETPTQARNAVIMDLRRIRAGLRALEMRTLDEVAE